MLSVIWRAAIFYVLLMLSLPLVAATLGGAMGSAEFLAIFVLAILLGVVWHVVARRGRRTA